MKNPKLFAMTPDNHLQQHLELCKRIYLRMLKDGTWPWRDSPKHEEFVESVDNTEQQ